MSFAGALPGVQSYQESNFKGKMFEICVFHRLKGCLCVLIEYNRKVPFRKISGSFGTIPVKTGE